MWDALMLVRMMMPMINMSRIAGTGRGSVSYSPADPLTRRTRLQTYHCMLKMPRYEEDQRSACEPRRVCCVLQPPSRIQQYEI